jgi:anti-anti-sigma regulatory factor
MTCKIERVLAPGGFVVLRVSGRIDDTQVQTLRESMDKDKTTKGLAIDLTEVTLVSHEASRFLPLWRRAESSLKLSGPHT